MNIEEVKNILKHMAFDEYEWFIETDEGATRIHPNVADNAIKTVLAELDKQEKIINAMAEDLNDYDGDGLCFYYTESTKTWGADRTPTCRLNKSSHCIKCIKQYYEKKVSEE